MAKETPRAPADASNPAGATKNEATLLTKVHDQLSKILASKTPADFSGAFGHYDPALACRVTGCLLEYYDDVELDGLSVLQFYGKCDEIIAAIRCLQFRAVLEAYRVEKMDVAAAVFREYLNSTWRSWPRPPMW